MSIVQFRIEVTSGEGRSPIDGGYMWSFQGSKSALFLKESTQLAYFLFKHDIQFCNYDRWYQFGSVQSLSRV